MVSVVHRFERNIGGHHYVIEASQVGSTRWRAQIARRPGMSSAMMPFYGQTADEAAAQLVRWLNLAHRVPVEQVVVAP
jgi:hypothetical protein